jgi:hypothetical protein
MYLEYLSVFLSYISLRISQRPNPVQQAPKLIQTCLVLALAMGVAQPSQVLFFLLQLRLTIFFL